MTKSRLSMKLLWQMLVEAPLVSSEEIVGAKNFLRFVEQQSSTRYIAKSIKPQTKTGAKTPKPKTI